MRKGIISDRAALLTSNNYQELGIECLSWGFDISDDSIKDGSGYSFCNVYDGYLVQSVGALEVR